MLRKRECDFKLSTEEIHFFHSTLPDFYPHKLENDHYLEMEITYWNSQLCTKTSPKHNVLVMLPQKNYLLISPYLNLFVELELLFFETLSVFLGLGFDGAVTTGVDFFCHRERKIENEIVDFNKEVI
jgi:hypothetical protein